MYKLLAGFKVKEDSAAAEDTRLYVISYKNLLALDPEIASRAANIMIYAFCVPLWIILMCFWIPMLIVQFKTFSKGLTPYPKSAKWFNLIVGMIPALVIALLIGPILRWAAGSARCS